MCVCVCVCVCIKVKVRCIRIAIVAVEKHTYSDYVSVALVIHLTMHMRRTAIVICGPSASTVLLHFIS